MRPRADAGAAPQWRRPLLWRRDPLAILQQLTGGETRVDDFVPALVSRTIGTVRAHLAGQRAWSPAAGADRCSAPLPTRS